MAWFSGGASNRALVENLASNNLITTERVKNAMLAVDRAHFAPAAPYADSPQSIGHAATISAPHMHAAAAESLLPFLNPAATTRVLDIGSGSGYLTAVLANLVTPSLTARVASHSGGGEAVGGGGAASGEGAGEGAGTVIGIDHIQALVDMARGNMGKSEEGKKMLDTGQVQFVKGDGRKGWAEGAPYDAIHVGAAAAEHHQILVDQLKKPGRLFVPVEEDFMQHIYVIDKKEDGTVTRKKVMAVRYVPLTDAPKE
ncbi:MAG: hypothetical protein M1821_004156 [Bathelium mastoideum]|nr:MAG: hypothetical protein M1821_004156 [Bathelium mastoideum]